MVNKRSSSTRQVRRPSKGIQRMDRLDQELTSASTLNREDEFLKGPTTGDRKPKIRRNAQPRTQDKLELGISILQHVEGQLNRADAKAQFTLTLDALLIASSAFLWTGETGDVARLSSTMFPNRLVPILGIAMFVALLMSTIYALLAVIPRFTPKDLASNNIFYFGNIVQQGKKDFAEQYISQPYQEIEKMLMSEIYDLAGIAKQKFSLIRVSYLFLFFSLGFWSILQVIILLAT